MWMQRCFLFVFLTGLVSQFLANAYPMLLEIPESSERCLRLNIPEDDDAHMVFLALPSPTHDEEEGKVPKFITMYEELETHFFNQMIKITKSGNKMTLPQKFQEDPSKELKSAMDSFISYFEGQIKSGCLIKLSNPESSSSRRMDSFWFTPIVVNYLRKSIRSHRDEREVIPLEGYSVCFDNTNDDYPLHIMVDSVMLSEEFGVGDDDALTEDVALQVSHLTPLAEQLEQSLAAAKSVIKEMNYMERREARMRLTADSINSRVRYFSYISVAVLLAVTFVQVTYLKRYFRKKKLL